MPLSDREPVLDTADAVELFTAYADYYRSAVARKLEGLTDEQVRAAVLPTGWSPLELLNHLVHMERRWFVWGFLGESVSQPWGDHVDGDPNGRWEVPAAVTAEDLIGSLHAGGTRTRSIVSAAEPGDYSAVGGRFSADPPTLAWICFHVLQEYARHVGHLDAARELIDGTTGE